MRRAVALVLIVAMAVLGAPLAGYAAEKPAPQGPTGNVSGKITDGTVQNIQLRAPNGQLVGTTTANAAGEFSFTTLSPGRYMLELVVGPGKIATMAVEVLAGQTATVTISATALAGALATAAGGGILGMSTALGVTTIALGATAIGVVTYQVTKKDASPSK